MPGTGWTEWNAASAKRRREQIEHMATRTERPEKGDSGQAGVRAWLDYLPPAGDRPSCRQTLRDAQPVNSLSVVADIVPGRAAVDAVLLGRPMPSPPKTWVTYDLTCKRCKRRGTHATFVRHKDKLFPLFDLLTEQGRVRVTVAELTAVATRWDAERASAHE